MAQRKRVPVGDDGRPILDFGRDPEPDEREPTEPATCDCPDLDPADWDGVESDWSDITFVRGSTPAVLGVLTGLDSTRDELRRRAQAIGATIPDDAMILLGSGQFRRPVLLEVEDAPDQRDVVRPGGIAFSRIKEAPFGTIKKAVEETEREAKERYGRRPSDTWLWYLTCRVCSKARNFETLVVAHYDNAP